MKQIWQKLQKEWLSADEYNEFANRQLEFLLKKLECDFSNNDILKIKKKLSIKIV